MHKLPSDQSTENAVLPANTSAITNHIVNLDPINESHNGRNIISSVLNVPNSSSSSKTCKNGRCETKTCTNGICKTVIVHSTKHLSQNHPSFPGMKAANDATPPGHSEVSEITSYGHGKDSSLPLNSALMSSSSSKVCKDGKCEKTTCKNGVCKKITVHSTKHVSQIHPAFDGIKTTNHKTFHPIPGQSQVSVITSNDNNLSPKVDETHVIKFVPDQEHSNIYSIRSFGNDGRNDTAFLPAPEMVNNSITIISGKSPNISGPLTDTPETSLPMKLDEADTTTIAPDQENSNDSIITIIGNNQNIPAPLADKQKTSLPPKLDESDVTAPIPDQENSNISIITINGKNQNIPAPLTDKQKTSLPPRLDESDVTAPIPEQENSNIPIITINENNQNIPAPLTDKQKTSLPSKLDESDVTAPIPDQENSNISIIKINGNNQDISAPLTDKQKTPLSPKVDETDPLTFAPDQENSNISIITISENNPNSSAPLTRKQKTPLSPKVVKTKTITTHSKKHLSPIHPAIPGTDEINGISFHPAPEYSNVSTIIYNGNDGKIPSTSTDVQSPSKSKISVVKSYGHNQGPSVPLNNIMRSFSSSSKICKNGICETKTCKNGTCNTVNVLSTKHQSHEHPALHEIKGTNSGANVHHDNLQGNNLFGDSGQNIMIHNTHHDSETLPAHGKIKQVTKTCKNGNCSIKTTLMKGTGSNSEPSNLLDNKNFPKSQASAPSSLPLQNTGHATGYSYSCVNGVCSNKTWTQPKELSQMTSHH